MLLGGRYCSRDPRRGRGPLASIPSFRRNRSNPNLHVAIRLRRSTTAQLAQMLRRPIGRRAVKRGPVDELDVELVDQEADRERHFHLCELPARAD